MLFGDWLNNLNAHRALTSGRSSQRRHTRDLSAEVRSIELLEERHLLSAANSFVDFDSLVVDTNAYDDSRVLIQLHEGATTEKLAGMFDGAVFESTATLVPDLWQVELPDNVSVETALETFRQDASVMFAEPDYVIQLEATSNDTYFGSLWGLNNTGQSGGTFDADIDAVEAWNTTTGSRSTIVAVIDTGVDYTHPDLAANIWVNTDEVAGNGVDDDGNGYVDDIHGYDFVNNDGDPMDDQNHGTHVAGTIGAVGNNGTGIVGVNWNVQIMALKFLSASGSGYSSDAVRALDYAVANGAHISNNSWGGGGASNAMSSAISRARNAGHIFVAAAGNDGTDNDSSPHYPSNYTQDNVISVAATDRNDQLASFSNYGATTVDIAAPGVSILSTVHGGGYASYSGTSMATPHVAGVVALVHSQHPNWSYTQIIDQVINTGDPLAQLQGRVRTGSRLNAAAAVGTPGADITGAYVVGSTPNGSVSAPIAAARITFSESINAASFTAADVVSFSGPSGQVSVTSISAVAGTNNREFEIRFSPLSTLGTYTLVIGPNILDAAGNAMNNDRDSVNGEIGQDQYSLSFKVSELSIYTSNTSVPINDGRTARSSITVNDNIQISDLNVMLNVTHTWDGDLRFYLDSPSGQSIRLVNFRGGSGDNFIRTILDDEAALPISAGSAPFTDSFRPEQLLSTFDGQSARGTWQLRVQDWYRGDQGSINSWSLIVDPVEVNVPPVINNQSFSIAENSPAGTFVGTVTASDANTDEQLRFDLIGGTGLGTFTINSNSGQITVADSRRLDFETVQSLNLVVRVTDRSGLSDTASISIAITNANDAPVITPIADQQIPKRSEPLSVQLSATDIDGDVVSFSVDVGGELFAERAFQLHQENQFFADASVTNENYYHNYRGLAEKYFKGNASGDHYHWYYILPDGSVFRWGGSIQTSTQVATLSPDFHANVERIWNTADPTPADVNTTFDGSTLTITPSGNYVGTFQVNVSATDGNAVSTDSFAVSVTNNVPVLQELTDQTISHNAGPLVLTLLATDADGDALTYTASVSTNAVDDLAANLHDTNRFYSTTSIVEANYYYNYRGLNEKYFQGNANGDQYNWYYILPNGSLYRWGGSIDASEFIGSLDASYHAEVEKLWSSSNSTSVAVIAEVDGNILTLTPAENYVGRFQVTVSATDGFDTASSSFTVDVTNAVPTLNSIPDQTISHNAGPLTIELPISDADGDSLTITADIQMTAADRIASDLHTANHFYSTSAVEDRNYYHNYRGVNEKYFQGNANGNQYNWYYILPDGSLYRWGGSIDASQLMGTLDESYHANINRLWTASKSIADNVTATIDGTSLTVSADQYYVGRFQVVVSASDGIETSQSSFTVDVTNAAPTLNSIADQTISHNAGPLTIALPINDADGDSLTITADIQMTAADRIASDLHTANHFYSTSAIEDRNYYYNYRGLNEKYFQGNANGNQFTWYYILPDGSLYRWGGSIDASQLMGTLDESYHANINRLWTASQSIADNVTATIDGNSLVLSSNESYFGRYDVIITANDGIDSLQSTVTVNVTNAAPVLEAIPNQTMSRTESAREIILAATDSDGETLSISAEIQAASGDQTALDLHAANGFYATQQIHDVDYYSNYRGLNEKYFQGNANGDQYNWYYILPDGSLYRWGGSIDASEQIGTLAAKFHENPELIWSVTSPSPDDVSLTITGNRLTITPATDFVGSFSVHVTASDAFSNSETQSFEVTVSDSNSATAVQNLDRVLALLDLDKPVVETSSQPDITESSFDNVDLTRSDGNLSVATTSASQQPRINTGDRSIERLDELISYFELESEASHVTQFTDDDRSDDPTVRTRFDELLSPREVSDLIDAVFGDGNFELLDTLAMAHSQRLGSTISNS